MGVESFVLVFVISRLIELVLLCVCAAPDDLSSAMDQVAELLAMDENVVYGQGGPQVCRWTNWLCCADFVLGFRID